MERRKFLIGAGSLAAGSAAAVGTGAFSYMNAERTVSVNVANDSNAFLGIGTSQSKYARESSGTAEIVLNGNSGGAGSGVNANADTRFDDVLRLTNNGDTDVSISISDNDDGTEDAFQIWVSGSDPASGGSLTRVDDGTVFVLETAETAHISVGTFLRDYSESDLPDQITITADESIPNGAVDL